MRRFLIILAALSTTGICASGAFACEMCRDAVPANAASGNSAVVSFNGSIYFMLGGFFVVAGLVGRIMFKAIR